MVKRENLRVRDPYILLDNGIYYMYVVEDEKILHYYTSSDLNNWKYGNIAFEIPQISWGYRDLWAGEVHKYKEKFYLFISILGKSEKRGVQIAVCDTPKGPFVPLKDSAVTPENQSCIDGTLYVENNVPYIVYSRDWPSNYVEKEGAYVGGIWALQLSDDLKNSVGEPWKLFSSNEDPISKKTPDRTIPNTVRYGSDAPFVKKLSNGNLLLTWSPYLNGNYVVLGAVSDSIKGKWEHLEEPIFDKNGGHAMFFSDKENSLCMCLHAPEDMANKLERACIFKMKEENERLKIEKEL